MCTAQRNQVASALDYYYYYYLNFTLIHNSIYFIFNSQITKKQTYHAFHVWFIKRQSTEKKMVFLTQPTTITRYCWFCFLIFFFFSLFFCLSLYSTQHAWIESQMPALSYYELKLLIGIVERSWRHVLVSF